MKRKLGPEVKYFRNYSLQKTWLFQCLKGSISEQPSAVKVLTGPKHCCNQHGSTLEKFFLGQSETLGLFFNTLNADDKNSCNIKENFFQAIQ